MTIIDIIDEAVKICNIRFPKWINFICTSEATLDKDGNIVFEDDHDEAGVTFCGLTQKYDNLPNSPTAEWVASTYYNNYFIKSDALKLQYPVGELVANISVNEGLKTAGSLLQKSIKALGHDIQIDSIIGGNTLSLANRCNPIILSIYLLRLNDQRYKTIATENPYYVKFLKGWLNRDMNFEKEYNLQDNENTI